jgi:hypothetical protein
MFLAQLFKRWTDKEEARRAVAADLEEIAHELVQKAIAARRNLPPDDSVRVDPHNRDSIKIPIRKTDKKSGL